MTQNLYYSVDVIVTTQKTIDLVFHTQVFKLQRAR